MKKKDIFLTGLHIRIRFIDGKKRTCWVASYNRKGKGVDKQFSIREYGFLSSLSKAYAIRIKYLRKHSDYETIEKFQSDYIKFKEYALFKWNLDKDKDDWYRDINLNKFRELTKNIAGIKAVSNSLNLPNRIGHNIPVRF